MVERFIHIEEVNGSNPLATTIKMLFSEEATNKVPEPLKEI